MQVQIAKTHWLLLVEFHQFANLYNAEMIIGDGFCCSDANYLCTSEQAEHLPDCEPLCDTCLKAYVSNCIVPMPCLLAPEYGAKMEQ